MHSKKDKLLQVCHDYKQIRKVHLAADRRGNQVAIDSLSNSNKLVQGQDQCAIEALYK